MKNIAIDTLDWSFIGDTYSSIDEFKNELVDYQKDGFDNGILDEICVLAPAITVEYWCYEGERQVTRSVQVNADNGTALITIETMFKIHNLVVEDLEDIDHHFFQGLVHRGDCSHTGLPRYEIWQGS